MKTRLQRFGRFLKQDNIQRVLAFICYVSFISLFLDIPIILQFLCVSFICLFFLLYFDMCLDNLPYELSLKQYKQQFTKKAKKILKEILMLIPILFLSWFIKKFIVTGEPLNQVGISNDYVQSPVSAFFTSVILAPVIEEFIFRFLPYKFISNKTLYILVSAIIFSAMHVINDSNPFYYIWQYIIIALYLGYRYYKTKDICVPISIHLLNNLIASIFILI